MSKGSKKKKIEEFPCRICGEHATQEITNVDLVAMSGSYCEEHVPKWIIPSV